MGVAVGFWVGIGVDVGGLLQAIGSQPFLDLNHCIWRLCCSHYLCAGFGAEAGTSDLKSCEQ